MTAPPHLSLAGDPVSRRRLRRLSRQFAEVGVRVSAGRLAEIAAGRPAAQDELVDIAFAEAATRLRRDQRAAKHARAKRRCVHSAVVAGAIALALGGLVFLGLVFFLMAQHTSPF